MYSVYQHWDPLKKCMVGKTYPPEFYSWIKDTKTRNRFEKLANETEEDYQTLIKKLEEFGVSVSRPEFPENLDELYINGKWVQPPTAPRDYFIMIHDKFWIPRVPNASHAWSIYYRKNKQPDWPDFVVRPEDLTVNAGQNFWIGYEKFKHMEQKHLDAKLSFYKHIFEEIESAGNEVIYTDYDFINGCFVSRLGHDLMFATQTYHDTEKDLLERVSNLFPNTINKIVDSQGHGDAVYCPVTPGLIISINDMPTYANNFPGWEVVYLPDSNFAYQDEFKSAMKQNKGRWFFPGFEKDNKMTEMVDHYFDDWVGEVHETVFDVNMLLVNPTNLIVSAHNDQVEEACSRHGVNVHVVPFRHKYFWDAGIHCITNDYHRDGEIKKVL